VSFSEPPNCDMDMERMSLGAIALINQIHFCDSVEQVEPEQG
jgi:hypothetical protein